MDVPAANINDNISGRVIAATVAGMILPVMAVLGRMTARHIRAAKFYADDYFIIIALVFKLAIDIAGCVLIEHGLGRHIITLTARDLTIFLQVQYTGSILYPFCVTFTKLSILYQYRRLFGGRYFRMLVDGLFVFLIMWCIAVCFTGVFLCTPISKAWSPATSGTCIDLIAFYYGLQIPNVLTDAAILILPLKEVADLKLPRGQKLGVALTCALWLLCLVFGIVRLIVMLELSKKGKDVTWTLTDAAVWTTVEPTVALVTACLPSVRVLYRSLADFCNNHRGESYRLRNFSVASGTANDDTLVENSRGSRTVSYGGSIAHEKDYGSPLKNYPSTVHSPISPTSPSSTKWTPAPNLTKYDPSEHAEHDTHAKEDV